MIKFLKCQKIWKFNEVRYYTIHEAFKIKIMNCWTLKKIWTNWNTAAKQAQNIPECASPLTRFFHLLTEATIYFLLRENTGQLKCLLQHICASNHKFRKAFWDKFPECISENFEIARVKQVQFQDFQKSQGWFIPKTDRTKHVLTG